MSCGMIYNSRSNNTDTINTKILSILQQTKSTFKVRVLHQKLVIPCKKFRIFWRCMPGFGCSFLLQVSTGLLFLMFQQNADDALQQDETASPPLPNQVHPSWDCQISRLPQMQPRFRLARFLRARDGSQVLLRCSCCTSPVCVENGGRGGGGGDGTRRVGWTRADVMLPCHAEAPFSVCMHACVCLRVCAQAAPCSDGHSQGHRGATWQLPCFVVASQMLQSCMTMCLLKRGSGST